MKQGYSHLLFPELSEAIANGYDHDFTLHPDGFLQCLTNPSRHYELNELNITVLTCFSLKASLYLITAVDGVKGHMIDYWEHSSSNY